MTSVSHFRGHLFADLRGYTSFIERTGNAAGAELVRRFREMVREEVGDHAGAEVKTEGDAVYVVFPSASTAVMCGLAIIDRAAAETVANPDLPMRVGIGVHAGEAVEVPEGGYIGTAVNLAARVCAVAVAGELLVTGTVRGILHASIPVHFVPRGRRRLKGISEPVELFRVLPPGTPLPRGGRSDRRMVAAAAAAFIVLAVVGVALAFWPRAGAAPAATPDPRNAVPRPVLGPLPLGEYAPRAFRPPLAFTIADPGWTFANERSAYAELLYDAEPRGRLVLVRITGIYEDPCNPGGYSRPVGTTPDELVATLRDTWFLQVEEPVPVAVDGRYGSRVDLSISDAIFAACDLAGPVGLFPLGPDALAVNASDRVRLAAVDVGGQTVSMVMITAGEDVPVNDIETFFRLAQRVVDSVQF